MCTLFAPLASSSIRHPDLKNRRLSLATSQLSVRVA